MVSNITLDRTYGRIGLLIAPIGYLLLLILPIYLEVIDLHYDLTDRKIGFLAATDAIGLALATLFFTFFVDRINLRTCLLVAVGIAIISNAILLFDKRFDVLCILRIIAGFGGGLLAAIGTLCVNQTSQPNRWFGFYAAVAILIQTICFLVVPLIFEWFSIDGVFAALALICTLPLLAWQTLPKSFTHNKQSNEVAIESSPQQLRNLKLGVLSVFLFYMGLGGIWAYLALIGTSDGLTIGYVSQALAFGMFAGLFGAIFFANLGVLAKKPLLFWAAIGFMSLSVYLLSGDLTQLSYMVILCVFSFFWSIAGSRLMGIVCEFDHTGKYISACQTAVGLGYIFGPILSALLVVGANYQYVIIATIILFTMCAITVTPLLRSTIETQLPRKIHSN